MQHDEDKLALRYVPRKRTRLPFLRNLVRLDNVAIMDIVELL